MEPLGRWRPASRPTSHEVFNTLCKTEQWYEYTMPKVNNGNYAKNYTMATIIYNDLEKTVYRHMISGTCMFL